MSRRKKKRGNPIFAVALLIGAIAVAGNAFFGFGSSVGGDPASSAGDSSDLLIEDPEETAAQGTNKATEWRDLLAVHGSFDSGEPVRVAFSVLEEARVIAAPAPIGETAVPVTLWGGPDPPELTVGVVMISDAVQRAVMSSQVVGVGDEVAGVTIQTIARDRVVGLWGTRVLTYDLDSGWPREFRPELARREREAAEKEDDARAVDGDGIESGEERVK
ncbi:MAG: hypothetical protein NXI31_16355 [bacterium]|nr:hypothetical protein [bacterium]